MTSSHPATKQLLTSSHAETLLATIVFITWMRRMTRATSMQTPLVHQFWQMTNSVTSLTFHVCIPFSYPDNLGLQTLELALSTSTMWWGRETRLGTWILLLVLLNVSLNPSTHLPCVGVGEFSSGVLRSTQHQHVITVGSQTGHHRGMAERSWERERDNHIFHVWMQTYCLHLLVDWWPRC